MDKKLINREIIINAVKKSVSRVSVCFSLTALFISILLTFNGEDIEPVVLIKLWIAFLLIGVIVFFRTLADTSRWAMGMPFIIKNLIFMPLALIVAVTFALDVSREAGQFLPDFTKLPVYAGVFLVGFTIVQIVNYLVSKAGTDRMNDALLEYRKEHKWDEEE